jgi:hypothetical protein
MAPKVAEKEFKKLEIFLPREFSGRPNGGKKSFVFALFVVTNVCLQLKKMTPK